MGAFVQLEIGNFSYKFGGARILGPAHPDPIKSSFWVFGKLKIGTLLITLARPESLVLGRKIQPEVWPHPTHGLKNFGWVLATKK